MKRPPPGGDEPRGDKRPRRAPPDCVILVLSSGRQAAAFADTLGHALASNTRLNVVSEYLTFRDNVGEIVGRISRDGVRYACVIPEARTDVLTVVLLQSPGQPGTVYTLC